MKVVYIVTIGADERERLVVVRCVKGREVEQVKRLVRAYHQRGDLGLVSACRGKPSNNRPAAATTAGVEMSLRER